MESSLKHLKIGFYGFVIAVLGVALGFSGFAIDTRWLAVIGFVITIIGILVGFMSIGYGLVTEGKGAIAGSVDAARKLSHKVRQLLCSLTSRRLP